MTNVGFIGLGSQGGPIARRIVDGGYPLTIWARRSASVEPFRDTTATVASTPSELGTASDVVAICVVADADVEDVLLGPDGVLAGMSPGGIVAIHSTIHPGTCRRLADRAAERGIAMVDAPVSGGARAAREGKLLVMAGGNDESVARCRPIFETFADPVIHLGPLGSGQLAKLLNNLLFTAQIGLALEAFSFAERLGMDRATVAQVLAHGSGGSGAASVVAAAGFTASGLRPAAALLRKDVQIMLDVAHVRGAAEPAAVAELARSTLVSLDDATDA
jgi:3-hydroxyisobutyrate dehydrogenase-like beta-hydroxyacid dehydrogenase